MFCFFFLIQWLNAHLGCGTPWSLPGTEDADPRCREGNCLVTPTESPFGWETGWDGQGSGLFGAGDVTRRCLSPVAALCTSHGCSHHICAQLPAPAQAAVTHVCLPLVPLRRAARPPPSPSSSPSGRRPGKPPPLLPLSSSLAPVPPWRHLGCRVCSRAPGAESRRCSAESAAPRRGKGQAPNPAQIKTRI